MPRAKAALLWLALATLIAAAFAVAATSPLLQSRQPVYILAGFAGIAAMALLLFQPLLAAARLPGLTPRRARSLHRIAGTVLVAAVLMHVGGLWLTSPPDVNDALAFAAPTPFSLWGVLAMWGTFAAALLAALRRRLPPRLWRVGHTGMVTGVVIASAAHALLIEGTMGPVSKALLCAAALAATALAIRDLKVWRLLRRRGQADRPSVSDMSKPR